MVDGLLLDIDGVLAVSWQAIPGAVDAIGAIRARGIPFRLITNTTTHSRAGLASTLQGAGFDVTADEVVTAVVATATYLGGAHPGAGVFVLTDGDPREDMGGVRLVDTPEEADVVVLGGASEDFGYDVMNRVFRRLMDGVPLVAMHRNRYWRTARGLELDAGAFVAGLEEAAGIEAVSCGKPAPAFFGAVLTELGVEPAGAVMVGDDIANDVLGAKAVGIRGVLVRTGKFREDDLQQGEPDAVLDSVADLSDWVDTNG